MQEKSSLSIMDSPNLPAPGFATAVRAIASSTVFFTLACFVAAMALLMSQPPDVPLEEETRAAAEATQAAVDQEAEDELTAPVRRDPEAEQSALQVAGD